MAYSVHGHPRTSRYDIADTHCCAQCFGETDLVFADQSQSRFDAALVPFWLLRDGVRNTFRSSPHIDEATDIVLAEAVRRYVASDGTPPGGEDQLQQFDTRNILGAFELESGVAEADAIVDNLSDRGLATVDMPEVGIEADQGRFFLTPAGIERGLALLARIAPADRSPDPNDKDMEELLLRYFINDDRAARGAQPLSAIFGQVGRSSRGWRGAFFDDLRTPEEKHALWLLLERLARRRLVQKHQTSDDQEPFFEGNDGPIRRYFEQQSLDRDGQRDPSGLDDQIDPAGEPRQPTEIPLDAPDGSDNDPRLRQAIQVDSTSWTGLTRVRVTHRNARTISRLIDIALGELSADGNAKTAQARTLLLAAKELTDAPEPPSDIIWELIQRAGAAVGLLDIFFRIFAAVVIASQSGM